MAPILQTHRHCERHNSRDSFGIFSDCDASPVAEMGSGLRNLVVTVSADLFRTAALSRPVLRRSDSARSGETVTVTVTSGRAGLSVWTLPGFMVKQFVGFESVRGFPRTSGNSPFVQSVNTTGPTLYSAGQLRGLHDQAEVVASNWTQLSVTSLLLLCLNAFGFHASGWQSVQMCIPACQLPCCPRHRD